MDLENECLLLCFYKKESLLHGQETFHLQLKMASLQERMTTEFIQYYLDSPILQIRVILHTLLFTTIMLELRMCESNIVRMSSQQSHIKFLVMEYLIFIWFLKTQTLKRVYWNIIKSLEFPFFHLFGHLDGISVNMGTIVLKKWLMFMRTIRNFHSLLMCFGVTLIIWIDGEISLLLQI